MGLNPIKMPTPSFLTSYSLSDDLLRSLLWIDLRSVMCEFLNYFISRFTHFFVFYEAKLSTQYLEIEKFTLSWMKQLGLNYKRSFVSWIVMEMDSCPMKKSLYIAHTLRKCCFHYIGRLLDATTQS